MRIKRLFLALLLLAGLRAPALGQTAAQYRRWLEARLNRYDLLSVHLNLVVDTSRAQWTPGFTDGTYALLRARNVSGAPLDTVVFEGPSSDSVRINGVLAATVVRNEVVPAQPIAPGATFVVRIPYRVTARQASPLTNGLVYDHAVYTGQYLRIVLASQTRAYDVAQWYPTKQVLTDKLDSASITITAPYPLRGIATGNLRRSTVLNSPNWPWAPSATRTEWATHYPLTYRDLAVVVSNHTTFTYYAHPAGLPAPDSVALPLYAVIVPGPLATQRQQYNRAPRVLEYYARLFGPYPYPREKCGMAVTYSRGMGSGCPSLMTFNGRYPSVENGLLDVSHELFHQWFGNSVRLRSWRHNWLSEGFAEYGSYLALEHLSTPDTAAQCRNTFFTTAMNSQGTVVVPDADTLLDSRIFDGTLVHNKGAMVLHMLRYVVNDDSLFLRGLRNYYQQYAGGFVTTADLQRSLETTYGRPLDWFFNQWVYGISRPSLRFRWNQVGTNFYLACRQLGVAFRAPVELQYVTASGLSGFIRLEIDQQTHQWAFQVPPGTVITNLAINERQWTLLNETHVRDNNLIVTGTPAEAAPAALQPYPNPCTASLTLSATTTPRTAEVLDLTGRRVRQFALPAEATQLPTATLAPGTYVLRLTTPDGATWQTRFTRE